MKKVIVGLVAAAAAVAAQAIPVVSSFSNPLEMTEINQIGDLHLFDSTLGTLNSALLTLNGAATFVFSGTNTATQAQRANLTATTSLFWGSSIGSLAGILAVDSINLTSTSGFQSYAVDQTRMFGPDAQTGTFSYDLGALSLLGSVQAAGGGTFSINCDSSSGFTVVGGGGNISTTQNTRAGCGATIAYDYTAAPANNVPEPSSLALMGLALAGLGWSKRRSASK